MAIGERIKVTEYWEAQLCQRVAKGEPVSVGTPRRSLVPDGFFDIDDYDFDYGEVYAVKRRKVTLDEGGRPTFGEWEWVTEWISPTPPESDD